jgi:hypothetical protein
MSAPTAAPAQPLAPERAAEPAIMPPPLVPPALVQALPPSAEVGPRAVRPAIPVTPAGPWPKAAPPPAPEARAVPVAGTLVSAEHGTVPHPVPPLSRPAAPGPGAARPAFRRALAGSPPTHLRSEPASGPGKALLTPEEKTRLDAMDPGVRDQILTWLMLGDPILMREVRAKLAPPRPKPAAPQTLPELLGRIREDPTFPALAADWLAKTLGDPKSYSGFKARCEEAWRGELSVSRLVSAYEQAMGPRAKHPAALFMHAVRQNE